MMKFRKILKHRAVRLTIGISLVVISMIAMFNATCVDGSLLAIIVFALANVIHLIYDKFWSWLIVLPFIVAYVIMLWIGFFGDYHLLGSKYLMCEYLCMGGLFVCLSIILSIICYLLKPSSQKSN
jgi:hypothetical protein